MKTRQNNVEKRFKIVLLIAFALFVSSLLILFIDSQIFIKTPFFFSMGLMFWFIFDNEMLKTNKYYIYCLIISVVFLSYTIFLKNELKRIDLGFADLGSLCPLTFLIIQWPTRKIYLNVFKREPKVDRHGKFADFIYTMILVFGAVVLSLLIGDNLK